MTLLSSLLLATLLGNIWTNTDRLIAEIYLLLAV